MERGPDRPSAVQWTSSSFLGLAESLGLWFGARGLSLFGGSLQFGGLLLFGCIGVLGGVGRSMFSELETS